ncbi:MAG: hypothetical protein Q9218_003942, partial [Villophora microphyllina]
MSPPSFSHFKKDPTKNLFGNLPAEQDAPGRDALSGLGAGSDLSASLNELSGQMSDPAPNPTVRPGNKRRYEGPEKLPGESPLDFMKKKVKYMKEKAEPSQAPPTAPSQAPPPTPSALPAAIPTQLQPSDSPDTGPFPYHLIPKKAPIYRRCAFRVWKSEDDIPSFVGNVTNPPNDMSVEVLVDAGYADIPRLDLRVNVARTRTNRPLNKSNPFDSYEICWYPGEKSQQNPSEYMIETFNFQSFEDWYATADEPTKAMAAILEIVSDKKLREDTVVMTGGLRSPRVTEFEKKDSAGVLKPELVQQLDALRTDRGSFLEILFRPDNPTVKHWTLPLFARRVSQKLGVLSQYWDEETGGFKLTSVEKAETIKQVGGGMYDRGNLQFTNLSKRTEFDSLREFRVYNAITPIRESQYVEGRFEELRHRKLDCYIKDLTKIHTAESKEVLGKKSAASKEMEDYCLVYVRLSQGEDKSLAPPPDVQIRLEWDNSSTKWNMQHVSRGKSAKLHGLTVHRDPAEFEATGTDFCAIVKKNRRVTMPPAQKDMSFKMNLPKAHVEVVFSYDSYQRELDAVNKFCTSEHFPAVNLRHLLMNGGKSNPLPAADRLTDLRRLPTLKNGDSNAENDARFSEALEDCKARLKNPTQVKVIEQLTNIKDSTLAVIGPPGTAKITVSSSVLWTLLYLGHKVVIVAASNTAVEKFLLAARESKPSWCPDKKFLRMETESIERNAALENEAAEIVQWEKVLERLDEYKRDFDQTRAHANFNVKFSRVPYETTLSGRIADMVRVDAANAEAEYDQDVENDPTAQDRLTAAERNPSSECVKFQRELATKKGSLRGQSLLR